MSIWRLSLQKDNTNVCMALSPKEMTSLYVNLKRVNCSSAYVNEPEENCQGDALQAQLGDQRSDPITALTSNDFKQIPYRF